MARPKFEDLLKAAESASQVDVQVGTPEVKSRTAPPPEEEQSRTISLPPEQVEIDASPDTLGNIAEVSKQGFSAGISDEAVGVGQALQGQAIRVMDRVKEGDFKPRPIDDVKAAYRDYLMSRDSERRQYAKAQEESPVAAGITRVVTAIPGAVATAPLAVARLGLAGGGALLGGVQGLASSNADNAQGLAQDTAVGAGLGAGAAVFPATASALGVGAGLFGDRIGMNDADRIAAGLGGLFGLGGATATRLAGRTGTKAAKVHADARKEVAEGLVGEDMTEGLKMNKAADKLTVDTERSKKANLKNFDERAKVLEDDFNAPEMEARKLDADRTKLLKDTEKSKASGLKQLDGEAQKFINQRHELLGKPSVVKDRYGEPNGVVYEKAEARIKAQRDIEDQNYAATLETKKAKTAQEKAIQKILGQLRDIEAEEAGIPASVAAKRGSAYQAYGTRVRNFKDLVGEEPEAAFPDVAGSVEKVRGVYKKNTPEILGEDPDAVVSQYEQATREALQRKRASLQEELSALVSGSAEEAPAVSRPVSGTDDTVVRPENRGMKALLAKGPTPIREVDAEGFLVDSPALPPRPGPQRATMDYALAQGPLGRKSDFYQSIRDVDGYEKTLNPGQPPGTKAQEALAYAQNKAKATQSSEAETNAGRPGAQPGRKAVPEGERYDDSNPDHVEAYPDGSIRPKKQFFRDRGAFKQPTELDAGPAPVDTSKLPGSQLDLVKETFAALAKRTGETEPVGPGFWVDERPPSMESRVDARVKGADAKMVAAAKKGAMSRDGLLGAAGGGYVLGPKGVAAGLGVGATKAIYQLAAKDPAVRARIAGQIEKTMLMRPEVAQKYRAVFSEAVAGPQGPNLSKLVWLFKQPEMTEILEEGEQVSE